MNASPAATAPRRCVPANAVSGVTASECAEPARRDRAPDLDAEDEAEQLDEGVRGVRDARLEVLARQLAHADREPHAGQKGHERGERHDVRRHVQAELRERRGREAGGDRRDWSRHRLGACRARCGKRDRAHEQPDGCRTDRFSPAAAEHRRQGGAGDRIGGEQDRPGAFQRVRLDVREHRERRACVEPPGEHVLNEVVQTGDRVQVDRGRTYAKRERALVRQHTERDLDERRRRRDLNTLQPERPSERDDPVLEVGCRVAGLVADPREPDQELDGRVRRRSRRRLRPAASTSARKSSQGLGGVAQATGIRIT